MRWQRLLPFCNRRSSSHRRSSVSGQQLRDDAAGSAADRRQTSCVSLSRRRQPGAAHRRHEWWSPGETDDFTRLVGSSLWWLAAEYESDARLDYRLIVDGVAQLDPLNPHTILGSDGLHSELKMPDYAAPPELAPTDAVYPAGTISDFIIDSAYLGRTRTYFVYEPAGQLVGAKLPSLYVHDGTDYMNIVDMPAILDRLIAERDIPPLLVVFVPPIDRPNEYDRDDAYTNFIAEELLPAVRNRFDTDPDPARTGTLGSAEGGLAALHLATTARFVWSRGDAVRQVWFE